MNDVIKGANFNEQTGGSAHAHTPNGKYPSDSRASLRDVKDLKIT